MCVQRTKGNRQVVPECGCFSILLFHHHLQHSYTRVLSGTVQHKQLLQDSYSSALALMVLQCCGLEHVKLLRQCLRCQCCGTVSINDANK
jgi:hypothetical protein